MNSKSLRSFILLTSFLFLSKSVLADDDGAPSRSRLNMPRLVLGLAVFAPCASALYASVTHGGWRPEYVAATTLSAVGTGIGIAVVKSALPRKAAKKPTKTEEPPAKPTDPAFPDPTNPVPPPDENKTPPQ